MNLGWLGDAPALPAAWLLALWLRLGWSLVLACLGYWALRVLPVRPVLRYSAILTLAAWALLPGPGSISHWLGLAFQAPSIATVLCCCALLHTRHQRDAMALWMGLLLGWVLLLDTFALLPLLPFSLYAWGFSPMAIPWLVLLLLLPWVLTGQQPDVGIGIAGGALVLFVLLRLPGGNVWDALLDPLLWLVLHVHAVRRFGAYYKKKS
ncbi:MAG: hypothetical protein IPH35_12285 [Rhodoferax sp.]|nr:hypothetical protein [Rhodoferax sp.]